MNNEQRLRKLHVCSLFALMLFTVQANAKVHKWVDEEGNLHLSQYPVEANSMTTPEPRSSQQQGQPSSPITKAIQVLDNKANEIMHAANGKTILGSTNDAEKQQKQEDYAAREHALAQSKAAYLSLTQSLDVSSANTKAARVCRSIKEELSKAKRWLKSDNQLQRSIGRQSLSTYQRALIKNKC